MTSPPPRDPYAEPERLVIVPRRVEDGAVLLVSETADGPLHLLSSDHPTLREELAEMLALVLRSRLGVTPASTLRVAAEARPVHVAQPRRGAAGTGWLRAVAVDVHGGPAPDPTLARVVALPPEEAAATLRTDLERRLLSDALGLPAPTEG